MSDRLRDISHVVSVQIFSRLATFLMNVGIARYASPEEYGVGFVSFQLFLNLVLFFPKECFRKVALRSESASGAAEEVDAQRRSSLNSCWLGVPLAVLASFVLALHWGRDAGQRIAVCVLAAAAVLETLGEPFLVAVLLPPRSDFRARANGEAGGVLARTIFMLVFVFAGGSLALAFAIGSLLYSLFWVGWFYRLASCDGSISLPRKFADGSMLLPRHRELLMVFAGNTLLKMFLTEGEKILLLTMFAEKDWGVFGLVSNLGSIVLRLLFAPTEEIAYAAFGQRKERASAHWPLLRSVLLLQGSIGWCGLCFGPGFSAIVIRILYGSAWADSGASRVLACYCGLLFAMALNGVLEAFMFATALPADLWVAQVWSVGASVALVVVAWVLKEQGPLALVVANCVAMSIRILVCARFIRRELGVGLRELQAPVKFLALVAAGGFVSSWMAPVVGPSAAAPIPWPRVLAALLLAAVSLAVALFASRRELLALVREVRGAKRQE